MTNSQLRTIITPADATWALMAAKLAQHKLRGLNKNGLIPSPCSLDKADSPESWNPDDLAMVCQCAHFLNRAKRVYRPTVTSYALKHIIERAYRHNNRYSYVHNGACITAAIALDFPVVIGMTINPGIGISKKSLKDLQHVAVDTITCSEEIAQITDSYWTSIQERLAVYE